MSTIGALAKSRIRHNRSQTVLTCIAFVLTACLLMTVSSMGLGIYRVQRESALRSNQNYHAVFTEVTSEQLDTLKLHIDVAALTAAEIYASIAYEKMNATLRQDEILIPGIRGSQLAEGRRPEATNEIAGPPAFFERLGYESPSIGDVVEIPHRVQGKGEILSSAFVITGLLEQVDLSEYSVADTRIVYSAIVSTALANQSLAGADRTYQVSLRAVGEDKLSVSQMEARLYTVAADIGLDKDNVRINEGYLTWVMEPSIEVIAAVAGISIVIALFAALVIYGIYYVSIITNVQELGKLKALGASRRQMRSLVLREGMLVTLLGLPIGLLLGFLVAKGCMSLMFRLYMPYAAEYGVSIFSLPILLIVIAVVFVTALLAMLRPMGLVSKISPMEAVRYQDQDTSKRANRKGYDFLSVKRLGTANLSRNRRRTAVTIVTMGLAGVLFLSFGGMLSSMNELDSVRMHMPKGDFFIDYRYENDDNTYPENNLNYIQQENLLGTAMVDNLLALPGVTKVEPASAVLGYIQNPGFEEGRHLISTFTREDAANIEASYGTIDYDAMVEEHGLLVCYDSALEHYGLKLGDAVQISLFDGERQVPFEGTLAASTRMWDGTFAMPVDLLAKYITETDATYGLYIWVDGGVDSDAYTALKPEIQQIVDPNTHLKLMSLDEELSVARSSMQAIRLALYMLIAVLGVVSFLALINTLVTSVITRRRELGTLQAIGLSNRQLGQMLWRESLIFTSGTLLCSLTVGNLLGYLGFMGAKASGLMGITHYHYPLAETLIMVILLVLGQLLITRLLSRNVQKESLVQRIQL